MDYSEQKLGSDLVYALKGRMTFSDHKIFREILKKTNADEYRRLVIDLSALDFIDSFGVGMLLIVKDAVEHRNREIVLRRPVGQVDHMVQIAKLSKLFTIE